MWRKKEFWVGLGVGAVVFGGVSLFALDAVQPPEVELKQKVVKLCEENEGCDVWICDKLPAR